MIGQVNNGDVPCRAKRIPVLTGAASLALIFSGLAQAQLKPAQIDSSMVRPSLTAYADIPAGAQSVVSATLGKADEAYRAKSSGQGYATENPANHLAARYAADGVKIRLLNGDLDLEFQGWGYGNAGVKDDQAAVTPHVDGNRIEYRRGALTEWYVNGPLGLEQGFTISQPPVASADSQHDALDIALRLGGNLSASVEPGRHALTLRDQKGVETLRYGTLLAYDASGRELESWMEVQGGNLRLRVNTAGARYPILVDPWVQAAQLTVSSTLTGQIGSSGSWVAVGGTGENTIVVGAPAATVAGVAQGAVFVFVEPTGGSWAAASTYELTASNGVAGDDFGLSVGIDAGGDTIVVGAPQIGSVSGATGVAYVFVEPAGGWGTPTTYNAELKADDVSLFGEFGWSVGIDAGGDTVVVGAPFNPFLGYAASEEPYSEIGEAYVFVEPAPGGWGTGPQPQPETAKLKASDGYGGDALGLSVGINESGNTVVAGAVDASDPIGSTNYQGAAYVFVETGGAWASEAESAKLTASDATVDSHLGWSVGISGNTVVAGAYQATIGSNTAQGAAYVFVDPGPTPGDWVTPTTTPTFNAKLTASDGAADDEFGSSVAISGSTVVVGAASTAGGGGTGASAAYVFVEPGAGWVPTPPPTSTQELTGGTAGSAFGSSVGISGNTIVVGAYGATNASGLAQGAAYVFTQTAGPGPYAQYSPAQVNFGNVIENVPTTKPVTVTNTGKGTLIISSVAITQIGTAITLEPQYTCNLSGSVSSSPPYPISLNLNDFCTYTAQFDPAAPGLVQSGIGFLTNTGSSNLTSTPDGPLFVQIVPLSGTGVATGTTTTTTINSTSSTYHGETLPSNVALVGNPITVNFTVGPTSDNPTGTVNVTDGFNETCPTPATLTAANAGVGSCVLTINQLPTPPAGTTSLMATYTPDANSSALLPSTSVGFPEYVVELTPCGGSIPPQSVTQQYGIVTYSWTTCLAASNQNAVQAFVPSECILRGSCHVTVTSLGNNLYSVVVKIIVSCNSCVNSPVGESEPGQVNPLLSGGSGPGSGPGSWPLPLLGFGALLGMLMVFQVARQNPARPRLLPAAGILAAIMLSGLSGCSSSGMTPIGQYIINVTLTAGNSKAIVPLTLNITK